MYINLYRAGTTVTLDDGREYIIDHVRVAGYDLWVYFKGLREPINADKLNCTPTYVSTDKKPT